MYVWLQVLCLFQVALIKSAIFVNNFLKPLVSPIFMREGASAVFKGQGRFSQYCVFITSAWKEVPPIASC